LLVVGEEVVVTEKLHGTNSRVASIRTEDGTVLVCGTRRNQVRQGTGSKYEAPLHIPEVTNLLSALRDTYNDGVAIVLFGEIFGAGVQKHFIYGQAPGVLGYRAFDIAIDGAYMDWDNFVAICDEHGLNVVPLLYRGPYSIKKIEELSDGPTTIGAGHVREGVVFKPVQERQDTLLGRVILKRVGDDYEVGQYEWTDSH